jgi:hypothetical protein
LHVREQKSVQDMRGVNCAMRWSLRDRSRGSQLCRSESCSGISDLEWRT